MMLVEFADLAMAIKVMCHLHYSNIGGKIVIISFSKFSLSTQNLNSRNNEKSEQSQMGIWTESMQQPRH